MNGKIIATKLHKIENGILGVQNNPEIQEKLNVFGYTSERIGEGKALLDKVNGLMTTQIEGYSDQFIATDKVEKLRKMAYSNYIIIVKVLHVVIARIALYDKPQLIEAFGIVKN
jgi:hypothetical protein